jgi:hypothetical protein
MGMQDRAAVMGQEAATEQLAATLFGHMHSGTFAQLQWCKVE